jgi:ABC-type dipeptide/oligopeptide/nickel transport system permease subunit
MSFTQPLAGRELPIGEVEAPEDELVSSTRRFWRRFFTNRIAVVALAFVALVILIAIFGHDLAPYSPEENFSKINAGPSGSHWLGTDDIGRDILTRIMYGARVSMQAAFMIVGMATAVALPIGLVAGYFGGFVDRLLMRVMDALFSFPPLVLALSVAAVLGKSLFKESIAISIVFIPGLVRLIRGQVLGIREETFVEASRSLGAGHGRIIRRHIFPNVASPLIVQVATALAFAVLAEAGLSFLGLGPQPPAASWGNMLHEAYTFIFTASWPLIVPGVAIALTVLAFNLVADGLRDALGRERFKVEG